MIYLIRRLYERAREMFRRKNETHELVKRLDDRKLISIYGSKEYKDIINTINERLKLNDKDAHEEARLMCLAMLERLNPNLLKESIDYVEKLVKDRRISEENKDSFINLVKSIIEKPDNLFEIYHLVINSILGRISRIKGVARSIKNDKLYNLAVEYNKRIMGKGNIYKRNIRTVIEDFIDINEIETDIKGIYQQYNIK